MDYQKNCVALESTQWHDPDPRLLHASMGLVTETAELMDFDGWKNFLEELGDICWYTAVAADALECTLMELEDLGPDLDGDEDLMETMVVSAAVILDLQKKQIFYGRAYDRSVILTHLAQIYTCVELFAIEVGSNLEEILKLNLKKLHRRFPDKVFNADQANNRNVDVEMSEF